VGFLGPHDDELLAALHRFALVSITDSRGRILEVNDAFCALSGYTRDELIGSDHRLINSGLHPPAFWADMWRTISRGESWSEEICNRAKDGSLYWVKSIVTPVLDEHGRPVRFVSIRTDITAMKTAERALVESRALFRALTDCSPVGVISMDRLGRPIYTNPRWQEIHGLDVDTALVDGDTNVVHPDDSHWVAEETARRLASEEDVDLEYRIRRPDGSERVVHLRTRVTTGLAGEVTGHVGTVEDVTEQHAALVAMRDAISAADAANRAKTAFLANTSHEIRTPLNAIVGLSHLVEDTAGATTELRDLASRLRTAATALVAVVSDVLDVSKIEAGALELERIVFDLPALLEDAVRVAEPAAMTNGLSIGLRLDPGVPRLVLGDPTRLAQVCGNLLANAVKYTETGGVDVRATVLGDGTADRLRITVTDTGIGVAADVVTRLFQPFVQADSSTTRRFGGTGLGLSIVRELAHLMGGRAQMRSEPGLGTTVEIDLPLEVARPAGPPGAGQAGPTLAVAIVTGDVSARAGLADGARQLGWRPLPLADANELDTCVTDRRAARLPLDAVLVADAAMAVALGPHVADDLTVVPVAPDLSPARLFDAVERGLRSRGPSLHLGARPRLAAGRADLTGVRVLLADDNDVNREVAAKLLERHGAVVRGVANGQEALDVLHGTGTVGAERFDVLLTDLQMPVLDGFDTIAALRRAPGLARLPVIAVTAGALASERNRAMAAGADDVVTKPIDPWALVDQVRRVVVAPAPAVAWPEIDGIDADAARALVDGDVDLFWSLLRRVVETAAAVAHAAGTAIVDPAATEAGGRDGLARRAHQLAGSASVVGAARLTAAAAAAEVALRDPRTDAPAASQALTDLRDAAADFARAATAALPAAGSSSSSPPFSPSSSATGGGPAPGPLRELLDALVRHDAGAFPLLDELAPSLRTAHGDAVDAFVRDVRDYEFGRAADWLRGHLTR